MAVMLLRVKCYGRKKVKSLVVHSQFALQGVWLIYSKFKYFDLGVSKGFFLFEISKCLNLLQNFPVFIKEYKP